MIRTGGDQSIRTPSVAPILAVLALLTAAAPLSVDIYTPSLPLIQADLGGGVWLAQASATACLLGIGIGQLVWGPLSDRAGRRPVILAGVIGWTITSALSAAAPTSGSLIALRALAGLCGAAGIVVARSVVRDISSDTASMSSRIGILSTVTAVAPVVAPVIGALIAIAWSWRADFLALTALGAAITLAFTLTVPETLPRTDRSKGGGRGLARAMQGAVRNRHLLGAALALAAHAFGFYAYIATASFVVEREFGYPPVTFATVFATNAAAMLAANLIFRRLVRLRHPKTLVGVGLVVCAGSGLLLVAATTTGTPVGIIWAATTLFAAGTGFVLPAAHSWGQATAVPSGAASALTGSAQFLGGVLGSPVTGLLGPTAGHLGLVIALSSTVGLLMWAITRR